jgi:hypothetical protein
LSGTVSKTEKAGLYRVKIKPDMAGDWVAKLRYDGSRGSGELSFAVNVKS